MVEHLNPEGKENENSNKRISLYCKFCKATNYTKQGFRKTQKRGLIQKYLCLDCGKYFTADFGFYRMRNSEKVITMSIDMYLSNLSSRKMRNQLKRHFEYKISHESILDWVRRYVLKVNKFVDSLNGNFSGKYYADETLISRGKEEDRFWACVDWDTRMIVGTHYTLKAGVDEAVEFLTKMKGKPLYLQTDAAPFYPKAFRKAMHGHKQRNDRPIHIINNTHKTGKHNVRIETIFSKIKDRVDDFRGLKALWSAPILLAGIVLQHNFVESHTTTGKYPSELAGLNLELQSNRWLDLIKLAVNP